jgi:hypothetical protein
VRRAACAGRAVRASLASGLLAACGGGGAEYSYRCTDGTEITARFDNRTVRLQLPDTTIRLTHRAREGGRYRSRDLTFWITRRGAVLQRGDSVLHRCRPVAGS